MRKTLSVALIFVLLTISFRLFVEVLTAHSVREHAQKHAELHQRSSHLEDDSPYKRKLTRGKEGKYLFVDPAISHISPDHFFLARLYPSLPSVPPVFFYGLRAPPTSV